MPLTAGEAAARLKLHPKTFRQKLRDGVVEGRLEGGRWAVEEQDLEAYSQRAGYSSAADGPRADAAPTPAPAPDSGSGSGSDGKGTQAVLARESAATLLRAEVRTGAWLLLAVGEDRAFGSNDGYDDEPETHYRWDDTVPNHTRIREGDAVVLWDKKASIGASVIDSIQTEKKTKPVYRCPNCGRAHIKARKEKAPRYRCFKCETDFDEPDTTTKAILEYTASYAGSWVGLDGLLDGATLRSLCVSPRSQLSLRPLKWDAFREALAQAGGPELLTVLEAARAITGGHRTANVRVRVGQGSFRRHLLATSGAVCAFTGPAPTAALEAAHLYSYARVGEHHDHGGLLMRRDLHRLFDLGFITVDPTSMTIDVAPTLTGYPMYSELQGRPLATALSRRQIDWLREHWAEHRPAPR